MGSYQQRDDVGKVCLCDGKFAIQAVETNSHLKYYRTNIRLRLENQLIAELPDESKKKAPSQSKNCVQF